MAASDAEEGSRGAYGGGAGVLRHASHRWQEVAGMEKINVARIPEVLGRIVMELEAIDGWLTLKTEPVLNGTIGPGEDWIDIY